MNILMGERYKMVTKETRDLFAGKYGTLPMPLNEEVAEKVLKGAERITCRPADLLQPEYEEIKAKVQALGYYEKEEDVLSYAVFEQVAEKGLVNAEKSLLKNPTIKNNKLLRSGVYVLKGLGFVAASLGGYEVGSKVAEKAVDTFRNSKQTKAELQES